MMYNTSFLQSWIKEGRAIMSDSYFSMLFDLQGEKVNSIIFCPGIKKLKEIREEKGFTASFLKELFQYVKVERTVTRKGKVRYYCGFSVGNTGNIYLLEILKMVCTLNEGKNPISDRTKETTILKKYFGKKEE